MGTKIPQQQFSIAQNGKDWLLHLLVDNFSGLFYSSLPPGVLSCDLGIYLNGLAVHVFDLDVNFHHDLR